MIGSPRFAKILIMGERAGILNHAIALVAILADKSPFQQLFSSKNQNNQQNQKHIKRNTDDSDDDNNDSSDDSDDDDENKKELHQKAQLLRHHQYGDSLARLKGYGAYIYTKQSITNNQPNINSKANEKLIKFCDSQGLIQSIMTKANELELQLKKVCQSVFSINNQIEILKPPSKVEEIGLRQILLTGFNDCIARKAPIGLIQPKKGEKLSRRKKLTAYLSCDPNITEPLYIHPHSSIYSSVSDLFIYFDLI